VKEKRKKEEDKEKIEVKWGKKIQMGTKNNSIRRNIAVLEEVGKVTRTLPLQSR
jgi:hypothetical protein